MAVPLTIGNPTTAQKLLELGMMILADKCPPDPKLYLCRYSEEYSEDLCEICWSNCLFATYNGQTEGLYTDKALRIAQRPLQAGAAEPEKSSS